jgi:cytochrome bd-type quinol oxidase subunit 1
MTRLATAGFPNLPPIDFPVLGNKWAVGSFFLVHILFGSFTMGTLAIGPTYELLGARRGDPRLIRYARGLGDANLKIFSIGATLAGFAVIFLAALYGRFFVPLAEIFFWPLLGAFLIWFPAIAALYTYAHVTQRSFGRPGHVALGYASAAFDHGFLVLIVGVDSFLLTPRGAGGPAAFFNASFWAELPHRFVGNISWASLFLAALFAVLVGFARDPEERAYRAWAARASLLVGFLTLVPQVLGGVLFVEILRHAQPAAFRWSFTGPDAWMWLLQVSLLSLLLVGSTLYFALTRHGRSGPVLVGLVALAALVSVLPPAVFGRQLFWLRYVALATAIALSLLAWLTWLRREALTELVPAARAALAVTGLAAVALLLLMGVIRTTAREPYTVYGRLDEAQSQGVFMPGEGHYP